MKKVLFIVAVMLSTISFKTMAQEGRPQFNPEAIKERNEKIKAKLKDELKLTDSQADGVIAIQMENMQKMRGLRGLDQEERMTKMKEIGDASKAKLKELLKDDKLVDKVIEFQEKQRKEMMEKMREMKPQE
ncbi:MAG: hypothetical protein NTZ59_08415 [Bacteroidetes bacterium]|jgi:Mg/Co/Ni transporter MgtE|nr:hypothetical protein [Bacteroidota bacterium]